MLLLASSSLPTPWMDALVVLATGLAGGLLPLRITWSERRLHAALALSTGIFLGAVFLHLLPSLSEVAGSGGHDHAEAIAHSGQRIWLFVLVGVLAIYLVEALLLRTHDHDDLHRHRAVGWASLVGLVVHALTAGVGYAVAREAVGIGHGVTSGSTALSESMFMAIVSHKAFEAFSLMTMFRLAAFDGRRTLTLLVVFSCVTPLGMLLGGAITGGFAGATLEVATALAAGTFLFVCLCELLPEVFHHREDSLAKLVLLAVGVAGTALLHGF